MLAVRICSVLWLVSATVVALSHSQNRNPLNRRDAFSQVFKAASGAAILLPVFPGINRAACLPGDLSPECIGVYKISLMDSINSSAFNTPEALKRNAPDLNYVKPVELPKSVAKAKDELKAQRAAADDIQVVILAGRLEEAGIKVLNLIPKITGAGLAIQEQVQANYPTSDSGANQMRVMKFQQQFQELVVLWSAIDIEIGQGLRGQMGASAVAQLAILKSIKEAIVAFDDFLGVVNASTP